MPRHTFQYSSYILPPTPPFPNGQTVYRPILVAKLVASNGNPFFCMVWPDSGADSCAFPLSFAIAMQLDPLQMPQNLTSGVGNAGNTMHYDTLTIEIQRLVPADPGTFTLEPAFAFQAFAGFTTGLEDQGYGLLGQAGFFEQHGVVFDHAGRLFHIDTP